MSPSTAPETEAQALRWDRIKGFALAAGLCHRCAAQLAWGVQLGFSDVHPPCDDCVAVVAAWPVGKPSGWRVPAGRLSDRIAWSSLHRGEGDVKTARNAVVSPDSLPSQDSEAFRAVSSVVPS